MNIIQGTILVAAIASCFACSDDGAVQTTGEGEGEGDTVGEGEGEGEGDDGGEGEEDGEGGEGEGEGEAPLVVSIDLGPRAAPTTVAFPFDEVIESTDDLDECVQVVVEAGAGVRVNASANSPACEVRDEDTQVIVYDDAGAEVGGNDDGGVGYCSNLTIVLGEGIFSVCTDQLSGGIIGPTQFVVTVTPVDVVEIGGACNGADLCDPTLQDQTGDGLGDVVRCIEGFCTVVETIAEDDTCEPADATQRCDQRRGFFQCLSTEPGVFACVVQNTARDGESCDEEVTAVVCDFQTICIDNVCTLAFTEQCLAAEVQGGASFQVTFGDEVGDEWCSFGFPAAAIVAIEPTLTPSVVRVSTTDSVVGVRRACDIGEARCAYAGDSATEFINADGSPLYVFVAPSEDNQDQGTVVVEEAPIDSLAEGDACDWLALNEICADEGNRCSEGICTIPSVLGPDEVVDVTTGRDQHCFRIEEPGSYNVRTSGACEDPMAFSFTNIEVYEGVVLIERAFADFGADSCTRVSINVGEVPLDLCVTPSFAGSEVSPGTQLTTSLVP
jgi:hypothetical protein